MTQPMPRAQVDEVEQYIDKELDDAARYDNREPLDESGIYSLHRLAERLYAAGFTDGATAEQVRFDGMRRRARVRFDANPTGSGS